MSDEQMSFLKKKYLVTMSDGSQWAVPVRVIVENHAGYYYKERDFVTMEQAIVASAACLEDPLELEDWARNNMDWNDVKHEAYQVLPPSTEVDWDEGWANGEVEIR
jgi:hypothetical protein